MPPKHRLKSIRSRSNRVLDLFSRLCPNCLKWKLWYARCGRLLKDNSFIAFMSFIPLPSSRSPHPGWLSSQQTVVSSAWIAKGNTCFFSWTEDWSHCTSGSTASLFGLPGRQNCSGAPTRERMAFTWMSLSNLGKAHSDLQIAAISGGFTPGNLPTTVLVSPLSASTPFRQLPLSRDCENCLQSPCVP